MSGAILELFDARLRAAPEAPALHYFGRTLTRADLDETSTALAAALHGLGVSPGDRVAISLQNTPAFALAALAAWRLGAIVVLVNPMYRVRELAHLLADSGARVLVADPALAEVIAALPAAARPSHVLYSGGNDFAGDLPGPWPATEPAGALLLDALSEHAGATLSSAAPSPTALLTYTSGTTGPAKGAMNTHANLAYEVGVWRDWFDLGRDDILLALAPLFHITGFVVHLSVALGTGAPLVLTHRFSPAQVFDLIERYRPTMTIASITAFVALMEQPDANRRDLSSLRKVFSGGAPVSAAVAERFEETFGAYVHNAYGLTETTSGVTAVPLGSRAPVDQPSGALSVGVPLPEVTIVVLAEDGAECPTGEAGELFISGPQVAAGYWRNDKETAATFGAGGVQTGDVGFADAEGWIYLVDRKKDMIVASGYKVWPREVEDTLYQHPAINEAAVVGAPDEYRGETVHAFVSPRRGEQITEDELLVFCRERLAAYKCPTRIEFRPELPKTATGKILRRELRGAAAEGDAG